jgi:tetratricopeptide (TPR) repeat protein
MFNNPISKGLFMLAGGLLALVFWPAHASVADDALAHLQHGWAEAYYQTPEAQKLARFESLAAEAQTFVDNNPGRPEPLIWQAIVLSSYAKFQGGLGALDKIKRARDELQQAEKIDAAALDGSVYTSLGSLYAKSPGWPLAFGDKKKAKQYLEKALILNPDGIDPNFFYGELLADMKQPQQAREYFERALKAPARPGREDADSGRRAEVKAALDQLNG